MHNKRIFIILVLFAAGSITVRTVTQINQPSGVRERQVALAEARVVASSTVTATTVPVESLATPMPDGQALLETHCAGCHDTAWIDQFEKPRAKWEEALGRMETMGVQLSDSEKEALLNYLIVVDKQ